MSGRLHSKDSWTRRDVWELAKILGASLLGPLWLFVPGSPGVLFLALIGTVEWILIGLAIWKWLL